jgi:hypothetical protein
LRFWKILAFSVCLSGVIAGSSGKIGCWYNVRVIFNRLVSSQLGSSSEISFWQFLRNQLFLPKSCKMWKVLFLVS